MFEFQYCSASDALKKCSSLAQTLRLIYRMETSVLQLCKMARQCLNRTDCEAESENTVAAMHKKITEFVSHIQACFVFIC